MVETTENNVIFNCSELGEWVIVYNGLNVIIFDQFTDGKVQTKKSMFTSNNKQDCLDFISENNLTIESDEEDI